MAALLAHSGIGCSGGCGRSTRRITWRRYKRCALPPAAFARRPDARESDERVEAVAGSKPRRTGSLPEELLDLVY